MRICTIIARNYLPQARVLATSYAEHADGAPCTVLLVDDPGRTVPDADEPFEILRPDELEIERFAGMAAMYELLELATAVKPWLLRHLLEREGAPVAYFDPDIRFFDDVPEIRKLVEEHGLVLTPHVAHEPVPRDDEQPSEIVLLSSGTYNLGFIALAPGEQADRILDWWCERLRYDCRIDHALGIFVDQRWFDLINSVASDIGVARDPGLNVAYWNLHERTVRRDGNRYTVNGEPLRFFHFSGFDASRPDSFSKHQTRTKLSESPVIAELCADYAHRMKEAGHAALRGLQSPYDRLADGEPLTPLLRRLYGEGERRAAFSEAPFTSEGTEEFYAWLKEPAKIGAAAGLTRLSLELYRLRPDVVEAYPHLDGGDAEGFAEWVRTFAARDFGLPPKLLPAGEHSGASELELPWGVNVVGYLESELGVGEAARTVITALDAVRVPVMPLQGRLRPNSRQGHTFTFFDPRSAFFPVNLICINADGLPGFFRETGAELAAGRHNIGFWWWEVSHFPSVWSGSFERLDEVWVATEHVHDALAPVSPIPVIRMRVPVTMPRVATRSREELGLPGGFVFLMMFDYHSVFNRKNPLGAIEAFKSAFPAGSGRSLVVKCINHRSDPANHDRLKLAAGAHPDIHVMDRYVSPEDKNSMIESCDCFVSLHRSEGFGLGPAEAMYLGKPVIATGYSGNLDFMTADNSYLVNFWMTQIGEGSWPYPAGAEWAEPDAQHAAALMQQVLDRPEDALERGRRAARDIRATHSPRMTGEPMRKRLEGIRHGPAGGWTLGRIGPLEESVPEIRTTTELIRCGPYRSESRLGSLPRRVLLRLLRPFSAYQQEVDTHLLEVVETAAAKQRQAQAKQRQAQAFHGANVASLLAGVRRTETALREAVDEIAALRASRAEAQWGTQRSPGDEGPDVDPGEDDSTADWSVRFPPVADTFSERYGMRRAALMDVALNSAPIVSAFSPGHRLPTGYGVGMDERVIEFPWIISARPSGNVLDAGATLNHAEILDHVLPRVSSLSVATLAPEAHAFPERGVSYVFCDLRDLPFRDDKFDMVVCLSTLEHVGMDNSMYGVVSPRAENPDAEVDTAVRELRRVLLTGGTALVSVPYGVPEDRGWLRQFDRAGIERLIERFGPTDATVQVFAYGPDGWRHSNLAEAADLSYRDYHADPAPADDLAAAARAVVCLRLVLR